MRVVLANLPNHEWDWADFAPPLGLLALAEVALHAGWDVELVDMGFPSDDHNDPERFYLRVVNELLSFEPNVVGLTSMGVNTHMAIEIARRMKQLGSSSVICAGGVHFGSIATELADRAPWIDCFIIGEGEIAFREVLARAWSGKDLPRILRSAGPPGPPVHPCDSYQLVDLERYASRNPRRVVNYEGGRGCVFKCAFCYSPTHYDSVREVQPDVIVSDWRALADRGFRHVFLVQDNFTNDPQNALAVCDALVGAKLPICWNGYATLPQLSAKICRALGAAGCTSIYLGVDAVTANQQDLFDKHFYQGSPKLLDRLKLLMDCGVVPTCAFMLNMFDYSRSEIEATLRVAAECALVGAAIRLNVFTRYPGSYLADPGCRRIKYSKAKVSIAFDCPAVVRENEYAKSWPHLFPFHAYELEDESVWVRRLRLVWLAQRLIQGAPEYFLDLPCEGNRIVTGFEAMAAADDLSGELKNAGLEYFPGKFAELY